MQLLGYFPRHAARVATCLAFIGALSSDAGLLSAQAPGNDSTSPLFTWRDAVLLGGVAAATVATMPLDRTLAERLQGPTVQENRLLGDIATVVRNVAAPGSVIIGVGLYTIGRLTRNDRAADLGLHGTEALLIGNGIGVVLKGAFGRARPYRDVSNPRDFQLGRGIDHGGDFRSFPSGHGIAAFAAAAAVTSEVDRWWPNGTWAVGTLMYTGAALAGASRMYNNRHWASDVLAGAAIGTFAGLKVVKWHHDNPGNVVDRIFLGGTVTHGRVQPAQLRWMVMPTRD